MTLVLHPDKFGVVHAACECGATWQMGRVVAGQYACCHECGQLYIVGEVEE